MSLIGNVERFFEPGWEVWRPTVTQDEYGGNVETYNLHAMLWGRMRPFSSPGTARGEIVKEMSGKKAISVSHRFYCFPVDIKEDDEIRKNDHVYKVGLAANMMHMDKLMQVDVELKR